MQTTTEQFVDLISDPLTWCDPETGMPDREMYIAGCHASKIILAAEDLEFSHYFWADQNGHTTNPITYDHFQETRKDLCRDYQLCDYDFTLAKRILEYRDKQEGPEWFPIEDID